MNFEGTRLADGRIYVPLPFVNNNFADCTFPLQLTADIVVNGEVIQTACKVGAWAGGGCRLGAVGKAAQLV